MDVEMSVLLTFENSRDMLSDSDKELVGGE
jgi:hypothetical protein